MDNQESALVNGSCSFLDPDQFQEAIRGGDRLVSFLASGYFKAELTTIRVGRLTLQRGRENLARLAASAMPPNVVGILGWYGDGALPIVRGVQMRRGEWLSLGLGMEAHHRTIGPVDFVSLTLSPSDLARTAIDQIGTLLTLTAGKVLRVPEDIGVWLLSVIDAAIRAAATTPAIFNSSFSADALEHALLRPMISCIAHGETSGRYVRYGHHTAIAKRFEAAIEANLEKSLPMPALCRSIGAASARFMPGAIRYLAAKILVLKAIASGASVVAHGRSPLHVCDRRRYGVRVLAARAICGDLQIGFRRSTIGLAPQIARRRVDLSSSLKRAETA